MARSNADASLRRLVAGRGVSTDRKNEPQFQSGPKAGTTFDFAAYGVQPIPVGAPCNDGVSSVGVAVVR